MAGNVVKTIVDLLITTLPLPLVLRTNMQRRQRYGVAVLFGLGYIVTGAGIVRTYFTWKVFNNKQGDQTWEEYPAFLGATVENNLAIICACAPTIRPLFPHFFGGPISRLRSWFSSKSGSTDPSTDDSIKRSHRDSRLGVGVRFPQIQRSWHSSGHSRSLPGSDENESDVKLVIQKHDNHFRVIELDDLVVDGAMTKTKADIEAERSTSVVTIGTSDVNPFDPRWDGRNSRDKR